MKKSLYAFALLLSLWACQSEPKMKALDLLPYGMAISVMAPDSASISEGKITMGKEVNISAPGNFDLTVHMFDASSSKVEDLKAEELAYVKDDPYFAEIVEEAPDGFLFKTVVDSTHVSYDFRRARIQGNHEFRFRGNMIGTFSLEEAKRMYEAVE